MTTIIGLIGVAIFFLKKGNPNLFFKIWVFSQFPAVYSENIELLENGIRFFKETPILNTNQIINLKLGLNFGIGNNTNLHIGIYLIPLAYLGIYKLTVVSHLVNKEIEFFPIKNETEFENRFPINGRVLKRVELGREKDWLLIECDDEISIDNIKTKNVLIKPKDEKTFGKKKNIVSYLRLVKENMETPDVINHKDEYPFYEWMSIKLK
ncbi:hypothetical protein [Aquimarina sp. 2201CG14-23]|uniref:hypothetical protein n=1 Tax=Aquimarina mycalae TaxID=3040073 RepID=UPI0024780812|nr:hypothetical protein [Aquimarina sp. 2201CG14-23]MDH7447826.1 hypothetical protein [Aquimarina sp. 2201CG14-23]